MQKISTVQTSGAKIFKRQLTVGLDLGDRYSSYCVLDEAGAIVLEQNLPTTPEAMKQIFGKILRTVPKCSALPAPAFSLGASWVFLIQSQRSGSGRSIATVQKA
jgi:predicted NBD/HSP70 family sugar kinase